VHYRRSGFPPGTCLGQIAAALYYGPVHTEQAIGRCEELLFEPGLGAAGKANVERYLGGLVAMTGDIERGRGHIVEAAAAFDDLGQVGAARYCDSILGDVELLSGDLDEARRLRESVCTYCQESEDLGYLGMAAVWLAEVVYEQGDFEAAHGWLGIARHHVTTNDLLAQIAWRSVESRLHAQRGDSEQALRVSHEAVARADATDALNAHADALIGHADVLRTAKRADDADRAVTAALELYERKGNAAARARHKALAAT
jgi:tetratricopeptide (TPR) repeat protein